MKKNEIQDCVLIKTDMCAAQGHPRCFILYIHTCAQTQHTDRHRDCILLAWVTADTHTVAVWPFFPPTNKTSQHCGFSSLFESNSESFSWMPTFGKRKWNMSFLNVSRVCRRLCNGSKGMRVMFRFLSPPLHKLSHRFSLLRSPLWHMGNFYTFYCLIIM